MLRGGEGLTTSARILVICIVLLANEASYAASNMQWERVVGNDARTYNPSAITRGPEDSLFVAGTSANPEGGEPEFWLWKIDAAGTRVKETIIARAAGAQQIIASVDYVHDMTFAPGGGAMLVDFNPGEPYFVGFDENAQLTKVKRLELPGRRRVLLNQLIPFNNGSFIAIGAADGRALTVRIDGEGSVTGSAMAAEVDMFTGGAALPGGGFVALGYANLKRGQFLLSYYGPDALWKRTDVFSGRKASIAVGADGTQVVVYDASKNPQQDVRIAVVKNASLTNSVTVPVVARSFDEDFRIAPIDGGRFIVAGTAQDSIVVFLYGASRVQSLFDKPLAQQPHHWMLTRVLGNPAVALTIVYTGDKELTTKVGVIRFRTD